MQLIILKCHAIGCEDRHSTIRRTGASTYHIDVEKAYVSAIQKNLESFKTLSENADSSKPKELLKQVLSRHEQGDLCAADFYKYMEKKLYRPWEGEILHWVTACSVETIDEI